MQKNTKTKTFFQPLQISHPDNLKAIIDLLDGLQLTDVNADIKGDAFKYLIDTMPRNAHNFDFLQRHIVFGSDITKTANIAKINMILAGDGRNNIIH